MLTITRFSCKIIVPKGAVKSKQQTRRRLVPSLRKEVMRMRLTFHIGKYTVTIIVRETSKKAKTQHDKKSAATLHK